MKNKLIVHTVVDTCCIECLHRTDVYSGMQCHPSETDASIVTIVDAG